MLTPNPTPQTLRVAILQLAGAVSGLHDYLVNHAAETITDDRAWPTAILQTAGHLQAVRDLLDPPDRSGYTP